MATYTSNYAWTKPSGGDPVDIEVLNDNLDNQDSIVHQAFLDLAPVFSTANTYAVKDVVLYDNKVWICHTAVTTAGAWTGSTNWTQTTVGETGGVATYADLPDKPSINGNELSGNKTGAQLGLQNALTFDNVPTANSTNPVKSGGVYSADEAIRKWTTAEAKSVSGNPITLTDGSARNAEGLAVTCNPKQNLHGYDHPWAGGAGKNKLPMTVANLKAINTNGTWSGNAYTVNSVTYTILTDSDNNVIGFDIDGKAQNGNATLYLFKGDMSSLSNVILNGCPQGGSNNTYNIFAQLMSSPYTIYGRDTGSGVSIASMSATTQIVIVVFENIELSHSKFYPMIRLASVSDATFEPYSNECPITGYTECGVDRVGKNKLPMTVAGIKALNTSGSWSGDAYTTNGVTFTLNTDANGNIVEITAKGTATSNATLFIKKGTLPEFNGMIMNGGYNDSCYFIFTRDSSPYAVFANDTGSGATISIPSQYNNDAYRIYIRVENGYTLPTDGIVFKPMIRDTTESADFEPYSHDTATIAFGQTVYGGSADFKTGKVTVTHKLIDLGSLTWTRATTKTADVYRMYATLNENLAKTIAVSAIPNAICELYNAITGDATYNLNTGFFVSNNQVLIYDTDYNTYDSPTAFKTAMDGVHLCYELATPTELTLTPAELELLKGYNYITTNGTTIALAYLPDSLLAEAEAYVDAKIPPAPSSDGTYVLTCTVTSGTPAYTWESST